MFLKNYKFLSQINFFAFLPSISPLWPWVKKLESIIRSFVQPLLEPVSFNFRKIHLSGGCLPVQAAPRCQWD